MMHRTGVRATLSAVLVSLSIVIAVRWEIVRATAIVQVANARPVVGHSLVEERIRLATEHPI